MHLKADWLTGFAAGSVFNALNTAGYRAYFVGGCVRNALLGAAITDIDVATDALPEKVMEIAEHNNLRVVPTGIQHGTVTFVIDGKTIEVTTFRKDVKTDGRHAVVEFSTSIEDDAKRRDFTMNALYADLDGLVLDPLGGLDDLLAHQVRFIENPNDRIREDYLRILRFFRFHALYGDAYSGIDADGLDACARNLDGIDALSKERVGHEMRKLLAASDPAPSIAAMDQSGVLGKVITGASITSLAPLIHLENTLRIEPDWLRRLLVLGGQNVSNALRLSKKETRLLQEMAAVVTDARAAKIAGYKLGKQAGFDAMLVLSAHLGSSVPPNLVEDLDMGANAKFPISAADFLGDLEGPALGGRLRELEQAWIKSGLEFSKEDLLALGDPPSGDI